MPGAGVGAGQCEPALSAGYRCRLMVPGAGAGQSQPANKGFVVPGAGAGAVQVRVNRRKKCRV